MTNPVSTTTQIQQQPVQPQMAQPQMPLSPSYNAVQLNIKNPGVNVAAPAQQPLPPTATQQWQA